VIPVLSDLRYVGTEHFGATIARAIIDSLHSAVTRVISVGSAHADYSLLIGQTQRFVKVMNTESDEALNLGVVAALAKYWARTAWGKDLLCVPSSNAAMIWKINAKDADYQNYNHILPAGEATAINGGFEEFRPYGSIPGSWRLFRGQNNWWVTFNGTHGNNAECRRADWWVWPLTTKQWCKWNIGGAGAGTRGNAVPIAAYATLPDMTAQEKYIIRLMKANADNSMDDEHFASKTLWNDSLVMEEFWATA
jgi:hypothetical protein